MICALLVFLGKFRSHEKAIEHYNYVRAFNNNALTIMSQRRYVKFFVGFLHHKLAEGNSVYDVNFFEKALDRYNFLNFNKIFEDMRGEMLDLCSICLGPFDQEIKNFDVILSTLGVSNTEKRVPVIRNIWNLKNFEDQVLENDPDDMELITRVKEWRKVTT